MTQEDKNLLLEDLCARLPYGVTCHTPKGDGHLCSINQTIFGTEYGVNINPIKRDYFKDRETEEQIVKPYLCPMSSMTEEEKYTYRHMLGATINSEGESIMFVYIEDFPVVIDWLLVHHFDFRGLIEKGLALEAPAEMYKN